jgi:hypothetical protein
LPPGSASLGELIAQGKENLQAPWLGLTGFFTISIMLSLLIFIGEATRDAFDPRKTFRGARCAKPRCLVKRPVGGLPSGDEVNTAVDRISFTSNAMGETVALVGESGSGKSVSALSVLQLLPYPAASHPSGSNPVRGPGASRRPNRNQARCAAMKSR